MSDETVALIYGDVGGHAESLRRSFYRWDIEPAIGRIPDHIHVVMVGDLVDRGPESDGVLELVSQFIDHPNFTVLVGNHEARFLGGPEFHTPNSASEPSEAGAALIRQWWADGKLRRAASVRTKNNDILVTHAGLTFQLWNALGSPRTSSQAVAAINDMPAVDFFAPGMMLDTGGAMPGPVWAATWDELIVPWYTAVSTEYLEDVPFSQVHGHARLYNFDAKPVKFFGHPLLEDQMWCNTHNRHSAFIFPSAKRIIQVDPGLGKYTSHTIRPFTFWDIMGIAS